MQELDGGLIVSPTDLTKFLACAHLTSLDLQVAKGERSKPYSKPDEMLQLLSEKGLEHEKRYLKGLREVRTVVEIPQNASSAAQPAANTEAAMRAGADVIYQAAFLHAGRAGYADFLLRVERPSELGEWSYDIADTKLARRLKVPALLQMATYGEHLRRLQGEPPVTLTVVAGDGEQHDFPFADIEAYARRVTGRMEEFLRDPFPTVAEPVEQCEQCRWIVDCTKEWRASDHLSFVAFLARGQWNLIEYTGITTLAGLAAARSDDLPSKISLPTRERLIRQATMQLRERDTRASYYELLDPVPGLGLLALPTPDAADLYLDFESDRYVEPNGLEYLAGVGETNGSFTALWAHDAAQEKRLTEHLIDRITTAWRANASMHVYHYAPYEQVALKRLVQRHGTREAELDVLLRAEAFVDLYAIVRQGLIVSKESYSIKKLEAFYWGAERRKNTDVSEAVSSVLEYEHWLVDGNQQHLDDVEAYNKDDVDSTRDLHRWLEERRAELCGLHSSDFPRGHQREVENFEPKADELAEQNLADRLLDAGHEVLAGLVGWHRREARPEWWDFFRYGDLTDQELVDDSVSLGQLGTPVEVGAVKKSKIWRYDCPAQETRLRPGEDAVSVDDHKLVGQVVELDTADGWIELKIGATRVPPVLRGLQPNGPINAASARGSLRETGELVLAGGANLPFRLLHRRVPGTLPQREDETPGEALLRIGTALDGEVLAVQGPPGTGKSWNAAKLIRALLDQGKRVGVTALSHAVIGGLLKEVGRAALQKATQEQWCGDIAVEFTDKNEAVEAAVADGSYRLIGGTAWLWSRPGMKDSVDVLVVDEAGQFSLADAVAVARCARSIVLLGDPQQLTQPTLAQHPHGAGISALEYLLDGHDTISADRGIFFDTTWRMHPDVNEFVSVTSYEGRLTSHESTRVQKIIWDGRWNTVAPADLNAQRPHGDPSESESGTGLRYLPVVHTGNSTSSLEEAKVVRDVVEELLEAQWMNQHGFTAPIAEGDILIVAPYNVQVGVLRDHLRERVATGLRIGTVDKFQGRQGAVVIYSTTSSSAADAPRGLGFLYDKHRLNVAVSRARAMAIMVGSPTLLDATVGRREDVPLVNAYCRFVEMANQP